MLRRASMARIVPRHPSSQCLSCDELATISTRQSEREHIDKHLRSCAEQWRRAVWAYPESGRYARSKSY
eukprot:83472-Pleurochrysis_carterae.AAC.1